tara:strand:- start:233 stop:709 length:477 start_codon:yes stop_codon:yes gene_type:complete
MILCAMFSVTATAGIWTLETTEVPQATYPHNVDPVDFEAILTTYNTYMTAFAESDFHTMADQMHFKSKSLTWRNRLDVIDNFSFIKDHILPDYSHSDAFAISFISPKVGGYVLSVKRIDKNDSGKRISSAWGFYEFKEVDNNWKISNIMTIPSLRSLF